MFANAAEQCEYCRPPLSKTWIMPTVSAGRKLVKAPGGWIGDITRTCNAEVLATMRPQYRTLIELHKL